MIKGLYAAASAMLAGVNHQNMIAHNIANMDTPGFKQVLASLDDFYQVPVSQPPQSVAVSQNPRWIGYLGLGVETPPEEIDFTQGSLQFTGQELDFAIQGPGFFRVQTPEGERYTRDGRFSRNSEGQLVTVDGYLVLDDGGQPIEISDDGELTVSGDGTFYLDGEEISRLGLINFANPETELVRDRPNTFAALGEPNDEELGVIVQNYVEAPNTNAAQLMTRMVAVARQYEAAQKMVQNQDELLGRAIASLGQL